MALRAAKYRLSHSSRHGEFILFPMIHVGEPEYFEAIGKELRNCDAIIFEGVKSFRARLLAQSYRIMARRKRLGLVVQRISRRVSGSPARLIHADVTTSEFEESWSQVPWYLRWSLLALAPTYGLWLFLTASRASIARHLDTDDLESRHDILRDDEHPWFRSAMLTTRDAKLVDAIEALIRSSPDFERAAVIYGAGHMRVVSHLLMDKYGYRVTHSEWLTVFSHDA